MNYEFSIERNYDHFINGKSIFIFVFEFRNKTAFVFKNPKLKERL